MAMVTRTLRYITEASQGTLRSGNLERSVTGVATDSRQVRSGDLFVALRGDRYDGHAFVGDAVADGAGAVMVEAGASPSVAKDCACLEVDDPRRALGRLAARYRQDMDLPVIAVAGSNGKTTTKELIASVLGRRFNVHWSPASYNNDVGVPLTLLGIQRDHQVAVVEVGTNHPGELAPLVRMCRPQMGVLTSLAREHLEFFGGLAGVVEEEGWLAELLPPTGTLWLNGDSPMMDQIISRCQARVVRAGLGGHNDWRARDLSTNTQGLRFAVETAVPNVSGEYRIGLLGRHQVTNALLALAVGAELGLGAEDLRRGLEVCRPLNHRLERVEAGGVVVLDDAYNANADSALAALETLREHPCTGRRVAVLGDMAEQGDSGPSVHTELGRRVAELKLDQFFAVGMMAEVMARAARSSGFTKVVEFAEAGAATEAVEQFVRPGDVVLVKASRTLRLERVREALCRAATTVPGC